MSIKPGGLEQHESPLVLANGLSCIIAKDTLLKRDQTLASVDGGPVKYIAAVGAVWRTLRTFTLDESAYSGLKVIRIVSVPDLRYLFLKNLQVESDQTVLKKAVAKTKKQVFLIFLSQFLFYFYLVIFVCAKF